MHHLKSCLLAFAFASCAAATPVPQAASSTVDPYRDVVIIPQDECPKFGGWIAKTQAAQADEDTHLILQERDWKNKVLDAQGAQKLAEMQFKRSEEALSRASWLARWGFPLGVALGIAGSALVAGTVYGIVHNVR